MNKVGYIYDEVFLLHEPPSWHPDSADRLLNIVTTLKVSDLWGMLAHIKPRKATPEDLALVHTPEAIERIKNMGAGAVDEDTYASAKSFEAASYAAGAVTARAAIPGGEAGNLPSFIPCVWRRIPQEYWRWSSIRSPRRR